MEQTKWVPKTKRVVCTKCSRDLKLAYGKCSHKSYCSRCLQKVSVSLAETCTYLAVVYREDVPEDDLEPPVTLKSGDMELINWMQRLFSETLNLWVSKSLESVQVSGTPVFAFSKTVHKMTTEQREEMKILNLRIPSHLMDDPNVESDEESSITLEGHYAIGRDEDIDDQPTVSTDGHKGHISSDNLDREFKNFTVSDLNHNSVAMDVDGQEAATMTRANQPSKEMRLSSSNPPPPVKQLDDTLDFEEGS